MIIVRNEKLVKRNNLIGRYSGLLAIIVLAAGMYLTFRFQEEILYSLLALVIGFTLSQISIFYTNRFGRSPRPDQELDTALKGFDDQYVLYHYQSPVSHLLVGPAGVWILLPFTLKGKITYNEKRGKWQKSGGNLYMRFFAQDSLGNPDGEISAGLKRIKREFLKIPELDIPDIQAALVFVNEGAEVEAENAPYPTLHARQLKKLIRKEVKSDFSLSRTTMKTIQDYLGLESIA
jgi:hypothetical protein